MSRIKIGAQVTAKVCPTKVTVSGTFQGYGLQDQEDPTSVCGKVFYVKDGMQRLDFVYVDSIKGDSESEDERIRKELIEAFEVYDIESSWNLIPVKHILAWLERQKEQKPAAWSEEDEQYLLVCKNALNKYQRSDHWDATIILTWLENRLKSIRPQPYWKPSEEQIEALKLIVSNKKHYAPVLHEIALDTLYNDLKKL